MRLLAALVGIVMPACCSEGAAGLPTPTPLDFAHLQRPATPNTALAAPAGFSPVPDIATKPAPVPPEALFAAIRAVAMDQPRTTEAAVFPELLQVHYVVRSAAFNFPDLVTVQVGSDGALLLWSRSVYGHSDLGVNAKRLAAWLAALDVRLSRPTAPEARLSR